jgi:hypothetical protein
VNSIQLDSHNTLNAASKFSTTVTVSHLVKCLKAKVCGKQPTSVLSHPPSQFHVAEATEQHGCLWFQLDYSIMILVLVEMNRLQMVLCSGNTNNINSLHKLY